MADIIRPVFGSLTSTKASSSRTAEAWQSVEIVCLTTGYLVGFIREAGEQGPMIRVVIGLADSDELQAVALVPDDPGRPDDALTCALATL